MVDFVGVHRLYSGRTTPLLCQLSPQNVLSFHASPGGHVELIHMSNGNSVRNQIIVSLVRRCVEYKFFLVVEHAHMGLSARLSTGAYIFLDLF